MLSREDRRRTLNVNRRWPSIRLREHHTSLRRLARHHALALFLGPVERDAADRRLGLGGDLVFRLAGAVPVGPEEAARLFDLLFELVVGVHLEAVGVAELLGAVEEGCLHLL